MKLRFSEKAEYFSPAERLSGSNYSAEGMCIYIRNIIMFKPPSELEVCSQPSSFFASFIGRYLTAASPVVTIYTAGFNTKKPVHFSHTVYVCVPCNSYIE